LNKEAVPKLITTALPHRAAFIKQVGENGYYYLLDELEEKLLDELQGMLKGVEADKASIEQAGEILKVANVVWDSVRKTSVPPLNERRPKEGNGT